MHSQQPTSSDYNIEAEIETYGDSSAPDIIIYVAFDEEARDESSSNYQSSGNDVQLINTGIDDVIQKLPGYGEVISK